MKILRADREIVKKNPTMIDGANNMKKENFMVRLSANSFKRLLDQS